VVGTEGTATVSIKTSTTAGLTYQWYRTTVALTEDAKQRIGVTKASLKLVDSSGDSTGDYICEVTGPGGLGPVRGGTNRVLFVEKPILNPNFVVGEALSVARGASFQVSYDTGLLYVPTSFTITGLPPGMRYDPATGQIFGVPLAAGNFVVTVVAKNVKGSSNTVRFSLTVNPFPAGAVGEFTGLIPPNQAANGQVGGFYRFTVDATGVYSGSITLEGVTHRITGNTQPQGVTQSSLVAFGQNLARTGRNPVQFVAVINPTNNEVQATMGELYPPATTATITVPANGWRNKWPTDPDRFTNTTINGRVGRHNVRFSLPASVLNNLNAPQGEGYVSVVLDNQGRAAFTGRAADGTVISFSNFLGPLGQVVLHHAPYGDKGSLQGILTLPPSNTMNSFHPTTGTLRWFKKDTGAGTDRNYRAGFGPLDLTVSGDYYRTPVAENLVVGLSTGIAPNPNLRATFSAWKVNTGVTALEGQERSPFHLSTAHRAILNAAQEPELLSLTVTPLTGAFTGKVKLNAAGDTSVRDFFGQFIPSSSSGVGVGVGYFLIGRDASPTSPFISAKVIIDNNPLPGP
jgi:hypothetical protein